MAKKRKSKQKEVTVKVRTPNGYEIVLTVKVKD